MKFRSLSVLLITFLMLSCNGQNQQKALKNITPEAFAKKINETPNAQILDAQNSRRICLGTS